MGVLVVAAVGVDVGGEGCFGGARAPGGGGGAAGQSRCLLLLPSVPADVLLEGRRPLLMRGAAASVGRSGVSILRGASVAAGRDSTAAGLLLLLPLHLRSHHHHHHLPRRYGRAASKLLQSLGLLGFLRFCTSERSTTRNPYRVSSFLPT